MHRPAHTKSDSFLGGRMEMVWASEEPSEYRRAVILLGVNVAHRDPRERAPGLLQLLPQYLTAQSAAPLGQQIPGIIHNNAVPIFELLIGSFI